MNRHLTLLLIWGMTLAPARSATFQPTGPAAATAFDAPRWTLSLEDCERSALLHSPGLQAAALDRLAAEKNAAVQGTALFPQVSLTGSVTYLDKLPSMSVLPNRPPIVLGDHENWSAGATASWTVWDWGALRGAWRAAGATATARTEQERLTRRQTLLAVRSAYLQVRLALEQSRLLADSLLLAQAQLRDVQGRVAAGTAGRLDLSSAKQEALARRRGLREARVTLAAALRDLTDLTGETPPADPSLPLGAMTAGQPPADLEAPTVLLAMEEEGRLKAHLTLPTADTAAQDQPVVRQWTAQAEAARHQASAAKAGMLPKVQIGGFAGWQYPNQSRLETVQQNVAFASASLPLFDWGREWKQAASAKAQAEAAEARGRAALTAWERDLRKARDQYDALLAEAALDRESAEEASSFAKLVGESYRAGRSTYLEVESADLKALQAQVTYARTQVQVLLQSAVLRSLSLDEGKE